MQELIGAKCQSTKVYTASEAWHSERHSIDPAKLVELEGTLKIERVSVSVAKGGAA